MSVPLGHSAIAASTTALYMMAVGVSLFLAMEVLLWGKMAPNVITRRLPPFCFVRHGLDLHISLYPLTINKESPASFQLRHTLQNGFMLTENRLSV